MASDEKVADNNGANKLVVVTGASSGIGLACVEPFLRNGNPVLMLARNVEKMEAGAKELRIKLCKELNKKEDEIIIYIKKCDVTLVGDNNDKTLTIDNAIKEVIDKNKSLYVDCLVNNAGTMAITDFESQTQDSINKTINININGVINGMKSVITSMKKRKSGTIINISSLAGVKIMSISSVYSATKSAVNALTEGLRQELAPFNVKVCVVSPGAVATNLIGNSDGHNQEVMKGLEPFMKSMTLGLITAKEIADAVYYVYNTPPNCCVRNIEIAPVNQVAP